MSEFDQWLVQEGLGQLAVGLGKRAFKAAVPAVVGAAKKSLPYLKKAGGEAAAGLAIAGAAQGIHHLATRNQKPPEEEDQMKENVFLRRVQRQVEGWKGNAVGSVVGGLAGAELGPVGSLVGGAVGGAAGSKVGDKISGDDEEKKHESFQSRVEGKFGAALKGAAVGAGIGAGAGYLNNKLHKVLHKALPKYTKAPNSLKKDMLRGAAGGAFVGGVNPYTKESVMFEDTRHHFQSTADILRSHANSMDPAAHRSMVDHFSDQYTAEEPDFDAAAFKKASGYKEKE